MLSCIQHIFIAISFLVLQCSLSWCSRQSIKSQFAKCDLSTEQTVYEVSPGVGWDNLRNVEMGRVLQLSYSECSMSQDGKYLLPDGVSLTPLKQSSVELDSETFTHFNNYTSLTAMTMNLEGTVQTSDCGISGSYSYEHESVKTKFVETKSVISRVSLRHVMYEARSQPDSPLSAEFRNRLLDLASDLLADSSHTESMDANYEADMIVRDFGTHVITSTISGALVSKIDHLDANYVESVMTNLNTLRHSATASFAKLVNLSLSSSIKFGQEEVERYENNTSHSTIATIGGPPYSGNFSLDAWTAGLSNNLVATDRRGDPLFFLINTRTLQELPEPLVYKVAKKVKQAVVRYYKANTLRGCMDIRSPNFNENANVDSRDCTEPTNNFTLGGVYQLCSGPDDLCQDVIQKNPTTGDYSCSEDYESVELHYSDNQKCKEYCRNVWYIFYTSVECVTKCISLRTFWCSPRSGKAESSRGFLIGGVFSPLQPNPVTNARSCPPHYMEVKFGLQNTLCLSADVELGWGNQLSFGGFYSCSMGNPLARQSTDSVKKNIQSIVSPKYLKALGDGNWPYRCASGFTQHLAFMENSCEIMYCVRTNELSHRTRRNIRRPPFIRLDYTSPNRSQRISEIVGPNKELWVRDKGGVWKRDYEMKSAGMIEPSKSNSSNVSIAIVLSIIGTLIAVFVSVGMVYGIKAYRKRITYQNFRENEPLTPTSYQEPINESP